MKLTMKRTKSSNILCVIYDVIHDYDIYHMSSMNHEYHSMMMELFSAYQTHEPGL